MSEFYKIALDDESLVNQASFVDRCAGHMLLIILPIVFALLSYLNGINQLRPLAYTYFAALVVGSSLYLISTVLILKFYTRKDNKLNGN